MIDRGSPRGISQVDLPVLNFSVFTYVQKTILYPALEVDTPLI